jgi:hypothetical protein
MKWCAFLLLVGIALGQNPASKSDTTTPKTIPSSAVTKCRSELDALADKKFEDFQRFPTSRLKRVREVLETCLTDAYEGLSRYQLASAGIMLDWTERTVYQRYIDEQSTERHVNTTDSKARPH